MNKKTETKPKVLFINLSQKNSKGYFFKRNLRFLEKAFNQQSEAGLTIRVFFDDLGGKTQNLYSKGRFINLFITFSQILINLPLEIINFPDLSNKTKNKKISLHAKLLTSGENK